MITVGVDVHKKQCTVAMQAEDGKVRFFKPVENTREGWRKLLDQLPPDTEIALEVSTSGYFAMSVLEEAGWLERTHWVHTAGIDSLRKQKYDRLDAGRLARKLSVAEQDPLPEAWFPPPEIRQLRMRARERCWLAAFRTQVKNRLQSMLPMHGLRPTVTDVYGVAGRAWLMAQVLPEATRESVEQLLRVLDFRARRLRRRKRICARWTGNFRNWRGCERFPGSARFWRR